MKILIGVLVLVWILLCIWGLHVLGDYNRFWVIMSNYYTTPWYSNSWLKEPYTMYKLSGFEFKEYWTKNAAGDDWYVREYDVHGKMFWTILEKRTAQRRDRRALGTL